MSRLATLVAVSALWLGTSVYTLEQDWLDFGFVISRAVAPPFSSPNRAKSAPGTQSVRMKRVSIMDTQGFGQPVEAFSFLAPADWQIAGGVEWVASFNCTQDMIRVHLRATAPDGLTGFELFPDQNWQWSDDPMANQIAASAMRQGGCAVGRPTDAAGFLRASLVPRVRAAAELLTVEAMPEMARAAEQELRSSVSMLLQAGMIRDVRATAARAKLSYDSQGKRVDEWITASVGTTATGSMSPSAVMSGQFAETTHRGYAATNLFATRAPAGTLERQAALFATIYASFRPNARWTWAIRQTMADINRAAVQGAAERSRIWAQHSREMSDIITRSYEQRQAVQDRLAGQFSRYIRGVERYRDPSGREVDLSAGYTYVWGNGMGEYIMSDDPFYDPSRTSSQRWTRLEKIR